MKRNTDQSKIEQLEMVISLTPGHVYWKDVNGIFMGCNEEQAKTFNLIAASEVSGKTDYDFYPKEQADLIVQTDKEVMLSGEIKVIEEEVTLSNQRTAVFLSKKVPLRDKTGKTIGIIGVSVDITDRKTLESQLIEAKEVAESANKAKTEFVQNMQHDIRTPAAGVWGVLDSLSKSEKHPERKKILKMATNASHKLLTLCNEAVEFGDLAGHSTPVMEEKIDIRDIAKSIIELNLPATFSKNLAVYLKVNKNVPMYIKNDSSRLRRILINLIGNAIKFTHEGEVSLCLSANMSDDHRHGFLIIEVKDTGIGISKDKVKTVFEKFSRGVASNTNKYPGTGLGLYVVKTYIEELDGDIDVKSHEGDGSCFKVTLPFILPHMEKDLGKEVNEVYRSMLKDMEKEEWTDEELELSEPTEKLNNKFPHKVLIIEDDKMCMMAEKRIVSEWVDNVDAAENVKEGLKLLKENHYDLVISDLGLPDGSGVDIVSHIRRAEGNLNQCTPFIAMTAHRDREKHQEALKAGFTETATKPLTEDKTTQLLEAYPVAKNKSAVIEDDNEEEIDVIDLELTIKRLGVKSVKEAAEGLEILLTTLKEDVPLLRKAEMENDILSARDVLHKIRGGLYYSGTPRLERAFSELHAKVKSVDQLSIIKMLFSNAYNEVDLFEEYFREMIKPN